MDITVSDPKRIQKINHNIRCLTYSRSSFSTNTKHSNVDAQRTAMSVVTPGMRAAGWNVLFTIGPEKDLCAFAGIYQVVGSNFVTFRDVCSELRLCFEFPNDITRDESSNNDDSGSNDENPWDNIAFALANRSDLSLEMRGLSFVHGELLNEPVPSLPPIHPKQQDVLKYHIVSHKTCDILPNGCAQHLPEPTRCYDPRYLMPNKGSSDSIIPGLDDSDIEGIDMLAPKNLEINEEVAKRIQTSFKHNCLLRGTVCAVSRQGESWCHSSVGPGIQACHIVPPIQYHLYPSGDDITTIDTSPRGLITAWGKTWSPDNGILLDKTLHELFDARLFSIHPTTFQVRTFVPYDKLIQYHGNKALIHPQTDIKALRQHYEMCCIENMAAGMPQLEVLTRGKSKQSQDAYGQDDLVEEAEVRGYKRRRLECQVLDSQISPRACDDSDGFITPGNSHDFLANVNWELRRFQALHRTN